MKGRAVYFLMVLLMGFTGSAMGGGPVAVSPGGEGRIAVISQECPTFSWSQVEGAVSYRLEVFEMTAERVLSREEMERSALPVIHVEVGAPAFSWTPSRDECLSGGMRYVWYVGAISDAKHPEPVEGWSEGEAFEVKPGLSMGGKEAVKNTVQEYLSTEWVKSESYKELTKVLTTEVSKGGGTNIGKGQSIQPLSFEGGFNTFYGTGAGQDTAGDNDFDTFIGAYAGYKNTTGGYNTFVGKDAGYSNTTGGSNTFLGAYAGQINTIGYDDTFVGKDAGYKNTTGGANTFVGKDAGYSNTTGSENSFFGYSAGNKNTEGNTNTFLGSYAGSSNTTGGANSFLGYGAGYRNTTGHDDTFVGLNAGNNNTSGHYNTFVGKDAGNSNTTGSLNSFLGYRVGYNNTEGNYNTFLGRYAGYSNTTANYNTFLGDRAGYYNTEGKENTFLGIVAGYSNTKGNYNTFFGNSAGYSNTEGYSNTFVGYNTGFNTIGNGNLFLGCNAGFSEPGSNKLYIDNSSTSTPLIYGEFDNNLVVINGLLSIASSREYKEKIDQLKVEKAIETLQNLNPVEFSYKATPSERHAGFISEEVPESLTSRDRKAVSPMDIVAVLTKVVQELKAKNESLENRLLAIERMVIAPK